VLPQSWLAVILFVFFVAPGLLFDILSERRRASFAESSFREISRVVLASLVFTALAVATLAAVRVAKPQWLPAPERLLQPDRAYVASHNMLIFRALVLEVVVALLLAWLFHLSLSLRHGASIRPVSAWRKAFKADRPKGAEVYVRVRLTNGVVYLGQLADFTVDMELADRELILGSPLFSKTEDRPLSPVPSTYQRLVIRAAAIDAIFVEYRTKLCPDLGSEKPKRLPAESSDGAPSVGKNSLQETSQISASAAP
jgi:hypothetical protein